MGPPLRLLHLFAAGDGAFDVADEAGGGAFGVAAVDLLHAGLVDDIGRHDDLLVDGLAVGDVDAGAHDLGADVAPALVESGGDLAAPHLAERLAVAVVAGDDG